MTPGLILRRAVFVYESARLAAIAAKAPVIPAQWDDREQPFKDQFLEVIGEVCDESLPLLSPEQLHENWVLAYLKMGWVYCEKYDPDKRTHPDMVPYAKLGQLERDKDDVFVALCDIARKWIYDEPALGNPEN